MEIYELKNPNKATTEDDGENLLEEGEIADDDQFIIDEDQIQLDDYILADDSIHPQSTTNEGAPSTSGLV